jgi:PAS domain S-box-containing protein
MDWGSEDAAEEIRRLQRCINDLISVLTLPAMWSGREPLQIVQGLLDALLGMLRLDLVYVHLKDVDGEVPIRFVRMPQTQPAIARAEQICELLDRLFGDDPQRWPPAVRVPIGDRTVSLLPLRLGLQSELGLIVAGSQRADFPSETEKLVLSVAANQGSISLQEAGLRRDLKQIASELDDRVAERARELRNSEQSLRLVLDGIAGLVAIMTGTGEVETVNRQVLEYFGRTLEELTMWPTMEVVHPDDLPRVVSAWIHSVETVSPYDSDHRLRRADGVYRWFHARGLPFRDAEGRAVRWYVLLTDIHERKEAEEKLRRSEADLQEAQRLAHIGSWKLNLVSSKVTVSPEVLRRYDVTPEEDTSRVEFWFDRIHPEDRARVREHLERCLIEKIDYDEEYRIVLPDGSIRYQHSRGRPLVDNRGNLVEFSGTTMEVTEQVQARLALQKAFDEIEKSEDQLRSIINTIPTTAWSTRPDGYCDFLNERWLNYVGMTAEEAQGWGWGAAIHPDDLKGLVELRQSSLASGVPIETEARLRRFDGAYRWFLFRANPLRDESGKIVRWYGTNIDIDDRKRGEEALRASERSLSLNINAMPTLLASARPDGWGDFFNQRWLDYTGLSAAQLEGWGWATPIHPDDAERLLTMWRSSLISGAPLEAEARMRRFDGVYRWLLFRANALRDESGNIVKWYGNAVDIDGRKRAEEALRASELSWREIVDSIPGLVATLNPAGEVEFINRQILEYFGKVDTGLKNWAGIGTIHPNDLPRVIEAHDNAIKAGQMYESVHRLRRADGVFRWFQVRGLPVRDSKGTVTSWYLLLTDIDERKHAEEKLRRSEASLAEAQRLSSTGSFSVRMATDEVTFSEEMCRIFEVVPPVSLGLIRSRIHPEDLPLFKDNLERSRRGERGDIENDLRLLLPGGSVKTIHIVAHLIRNESGELESIGTAQDITQRRFAEEAVAKARTELANMARVTSLGVLTASIAHEVNQPLFGIITNASTCLRMLSADPPDVDGARETARRTIRDGNRASDVIKRLRALYSKKDPSPESVDLNEVTREVISLSLSDLQRHRVILRQELADDLPLIMVDRVQIQQVIMNLLRNASDAMHNVDDRRRELLIRTEREEGDRVRLSVKDAGVGFQPQAADRLFEAFYTTKNDGMGIGLSISRSIIEAHQGRLWATANDGPGATFSFSIPSRAGSFAAGETSGSQPDRATDAA